MCNDELSIGRGRKGYIPVTGVSINGIGVVTRVGLQEDDCNVLVHCSGGGANKVDIIEKPRDSSLVCACPSL